jgi:hypothetical protein
MHTFRKLPNTSPNKKNAAAKKYTLPARSKVFRGSLRSIGASEGDYKEDSMIGKVTEVGQQVIG